MLFSPIRPSSEVPPTARLQLHDAPEKLQPLTLDVLIHRHTPDVGGDAVRQTLSRTGNRVHVAARSSEWLFERHPADRERVSAWFVDHPTGAIVPYYERELRTRLGVSGWADVLMLGADARALGALTPTDECRFAADIRFRRYVAPPQVEGAIELWWNEERWLPWSIVMREPDALTRIAVARLQPGVDPEVLRGPAVRYPHYRIVALADWLSGC